MTSPIGVPPLPTPLLSSNPPPLTAATASYADVIDVMLEYGAVNAANLDGGSSSLMYYKGEYINSCASLYGPRNMPTSIIVR